jgi:hypothetical protein
LGYVRRNRFNPASLDKPGAVLFLVEGWKRITANVL